MHVKSFGVAHIVLPPDVADQFFAGEQLSGMRHQQPEQIEFFQRQRNLSAAQPDFVTDGVKLQVVLDDGFGSSCRCAG